MAGTGKQGAVEVILTDEALIYERRQVATDYADEAIRQLNAEASNFAPATKARWRRAITSMALAFLDGTTYGFDLAEAANARVAAIQKAQSR